LEKNKTPDNFKKENKMKKLTLTILLLILLLTAASASSLQTTVVNMSWVCISADNGISYLSEDPNEPESEFISDLIDCLNEDPNGPESEPECV
jgi:ABC-type glycerol-3-phosphate transport system substrate-binding protein